MLACPSCGRLYPEVGGAPTQVCPHCGHETSEGSPTPPAPRARTADPVAAIATAWSVARSDYGRFLVIWLPALVLQIAVDALAMLYEGSRGFGSPMTTGEQMELLGVGLPLYLLLLTVRVALWTFVAARVLDRVRGGRRLSRWPTLVAPALALGFVLVLTYTAGALLLLVGLFIFVHWFVFAPAMLVNGARGVGAAMEASRRFARANRTHGFTALVLLVGGLVYGAWFALDLLSGWVGIVSAAVVAWLLGPLVPLLAASYVAIATHAPTAAVVVATVAPARSTAKCPRCGTLIPYEPSGQGTEISCPSCGYAGRVL